MGKTCKVKNFAYRDEFIPQGKVSDLQREYGVSCQEIEEYIQDTDSFGLECIDGSI